MIFRELFQYFLWADKPVEGAKYPFPKHENVAVNKSAYDVIKCFFKTASLK